MALCPIVSWQERQYSKGVKKKAGRIRSCFALSSSWYCFSCVAATRIPEHYELTRVDICLVEHLNDLFPEFEVSSESQYIDEHPDVID